MLRVRIVNLDFSMQQPIPNLDPMYSDFRGSSINQVPVIRIFGSTDKGIKTCLHVHGAFPYIYIPYDGEGFSDSVMYQLATSLDKAINVSLGQTLSNAEHVFKISLVSGIPFYGYHSKPHQFFKIYFYNPYILKKACAILQSGNILGKVFQPHEAHIPYSLQFLMDYNLYGMSFVDLSEVRYRSCSDNQIDPLKILPPHVQKISSSALEIDVTADWIMNKLDVTSGELGLNPGIQALWDDEKQRRRNRGDLSQVESCLTQNRINVKPTATHLTFASLLCSKLSKPDDSSSRIDAELSVYPAETPSDIDILNASDVEMHSGSLESVLDVTLMENDATLDGQSLIEVLRDLREQADSDSVLSQVIENSDDDSEDIQDLSVPLQSLQTPTKIMEDFLNDDDDSYFDKTITLPQIDGSSEVISYDPRKNTQGKDRRNNNLVSKLRRMDSELVKSTCKNYILKRLEISENIAGTSDLPRHYDTRSKSHTKEICCLKDLRQLPKNKIVNKRRKTLEKSAKSEKLEIKEENPNSLANHHEVSVKSKRLIDRERRCSQRLLSRKKLVDEVSDSYVIDSDSVANKNLKFTIRKIRGSSKLNSLVSDELNLDHTYETPICSAQESTSKEPLHLDYYKKKSEEQLDVSLDGSKKDNCISDEKIPFAGYLECSIKLEKTTLHKGRDMPMLDIEPSPVCKEQRKYGLHNKRSYSEANLNADSNHGKRDDLKFPKRKVLKLELTKLSSKLSSDDSNCNNTSTKEKNKFTFEEELAKADKVISENKKRKRLDNGVKFRREHIKKRQSDKLKRRNRRNNWETIPVLLHIPIERNKLADKPSRFLDISKLSLNTNPKFKLVEPSNRPYRYTQKSIISYHLNNVYRNTELLISNNKSKIQVVSDAVLTGEDRIDMRQFLKGSTIVLPPSAQFPLQGYHTYSLQNKFAVFSLHYNSNTVNEGIFKIQSNNPSNEERFVQDLVSNGQSEIDHDNFANELLDSNMQQNVLQNQVLEVQDNYDVYHENLNNEQRDFHKIGSNVLYDVHQDFAHGLAKELQDCKFQINLNIPNIHQNNFGQHIGGASHDPNIQSNLNILNIHQDGYAQNIDKEFQSPQIQRHLNTSYIHQANGEENLAEELQNNHQENVEETLAKELEDHTVQRNLHLPNIHQDNFAQLTKELQDRKLQINLNIPDIRQDSFAEAAGKGFQNAQVQTHLSTSNTHQEISEQNVSKELQNPNVQRNSNINNIYLEDFAETLAKESCNNKVKKNLDFPYIHQEGFIQNVGKELLNPNVKRNTNIPNINQETVAESLVKESHNPKGQINLNIPNIPQGVGKEFQNPHVQINLSTSNIHQDNFELNASQELQNPNIQSNSNVLNNCQENFAETLAKESYKNKIQRNLDFPLIHQEGFLENIDKELPNPNIKRNSNIHQEKIAESLVKESHNHKGQRNLNIPNIQQDGFDQDVGKEFQNHLRTSNTRQENFGQNISKELQNPNIQRNSNILNNYQENVAETHTKESYKNKVQKNLDFPHIYEEGFLENVDKELPNPNIKRNSNIHNIYQEKCTESLVKASHNHKGQRNLNIPNIQQDGFAQDVGKEFQNRLSTSNTHQENVEQNVSKEVKNPNIQRNSNILNNYQENVAETHAKESYQNKVQRNLDVTHIRQEGLIENDGKELPNPNVKRNSNIPNIYEGNFGETFAQESRSHEVQRNVNTTIIHQDTLAKESQNHTVQRFLNIPDIHQEHFAETLAKEPQNHSAQRNSNISNIYPENVSQFTKKSQDHKAKRNVNIPNLYQENFLESLAKDSHNRKVERNLYISNIHQGTLAQLLPKESQNHSVQRNLNIPNIYQEHFAETLVKESCNHKGQTNLNTTIIHQETLANDSQNHTDQRFLNIPNIHREHFAETLAKEPQNHSAQRNSNIPNIHPENVAQFTKKSQDHKAKRNVNIPNLYQENILESLAKDSHNRKVERNLYISNIHQGTLAQLLPKESQNHSVQRNLNIPNIYQEHFAETLVKESCNHKGQTNLNTTIIHQETLANDSQNHTDQRFLNIPNIHQEHFAETLAKEPQNHSAQRNSNIPNIHQDNFSQLNKISQDHKVKRNLSIPNLYQENFAETLDKTSHNRKVQRNLNIPNIPQETLAQPLPKESQNHSVQRNLNIPNIYQEHFAETLVKESCNHKGQRNLNTTIIHQEAFANDSRNHTVDRNLNIPNIHQDNFSQLNKISQDHKVKRNLSISNIYQENFAETLDKTSHNRKVQRNLNIPNIPQENLAEPLAKKSQNYSVQRNSNIPNIYEEHFAETLVKESSNHKGQRNLNTTIIHQEAFANDSRNHTIDRNLNIPNIHQDNISQLNKISQDHKVKRNLSIPNIYQENFAETLDKTSLNHKLQRNLNIPNIPQETLAEPLAKESQNHSVQRNLNIPNIYQEHFAETLVKESCNHKGQTNLNTTIIHQEAFANDSRNHTDQRFLNIPNIHQEHFAETLAKEPQNHSAQRNSNIPNIHQDNFSQLNKISQDHKVKRNLSIPNIYQENFADTLDKTSHNRKVQRNLNIPNIPQETLAEPLAKESQNHSVQRNLNIPNIYQEHFAETLVKESCNHKGQRNLNTTVIHQETFAKDSQNHTVERNLNIHNIHQDNFSQFNKISQDHKVKRNFSIPNIYQENFAETLDKTSHNRKVQRNLNISNIPQETFAEPLAKESQNHSVQRNMNIPNIYQEHFAETLVKESCNHKGQRNSNTTIIHQEAFANDSRNHNVYGNLNIPNIHQENFSQLTKKSQDHKVTNESSDIEEDFELKRQVCSKITSDSNKTSNNSYPIRLQKNNKIYPKSIEYGQTKSAYKSPGNIYKVIMSLPYKPTHVQNDRRRRINNFFDDCIAKNLFDFRSKLDVDERLCWNRYTNCNGDGYLDFRSRVPKKADSSTFNPYKFLDGTNDSSSEEEVVFKESPKKSKRSSQASKYRPLDIKYTSPTKSENVSKLIQMGTQSSGNRSVIESDKASLRLKKTTPQPLEKHKRKLFSEIEKPDVTIIEEQVLCKYTPNKNTRKSTNVQLHEKISEKNTSEASVQNRDLHDNKTQPDADQYINVRTSQNSISSDFSDDLFSPDNNEQTDLTFDGKIIPNNNIVDEYDLKNRFLPLAGTSKNVGDDFIKLSLTEQSLLNDSLEHKNSSSSNQLTYKTSGGLQAIMESHIPDKSQSQKSSSSDQLTPYKKLPVMEGLSLTENNILDKLQSQESSSSDQLTPYQKLPVMEGLSLTENNILDKLQSQGSSSSDQLTPYQKLPVMEVLSPSENLSLSENNIPDKLRSQKSSSNDQLTPYQRLPLTERLSLTENISLTDYASCPDGTVTIAPKYNPPSKNRIALSLKDYDIPEVRYTKPYYSDRNDVTGNVEVGRSVLKIPSNNIVDLPGFSGNFQGMSAMRDKIVRLLDPEKKLTDGQISNYRLSFCDNKTAIITPVRVPPNRRKVNEWLTEEKAKKSEVTEGKQRKRLIIPASPGGEDSCDSLSLSPCSPSQSLESCSPVIKANQNKRKAGIERAKAQQSIDSTILSSSDSIIKNIGMSDSCNSDMITGVTFDNTNFLLASNNFQKAKATREYLHITILAIEVITITRRDYKPNPEYDKIQAIVYTIFNDIPDDQHRLVSGGFIVNSLPISPSKVKLSILDGLHVGHNLKPVSSEEELINDFIKFVQETDPDVFTGYEIETLSWGYFIERGYVLNMNLIAPLSRTPNTPERRRNDDDHELAITGRILIDFWRLLRHEIALQSYTFENIVYHILHERVPSYAHRDLTEWLVHPSALYRHRVIEYYLFRTRTILRIMDQLDLIGRTSELAKLFGIQFYEVLSRGSQFRVESMMLRLAKPLNYIPVSPNVQQRAKMRAPESLPLIMEPESKFYTDPVIVLDFQSLYPSMMIAYNYCFSTCLGRIEHLGQETAFEFGASQLKIPRRYLRKFLKRDELNISPCGVAYVKKSVRLGILPRMLYEILDTRLMVKKSLKENAGDKNLERVLDARQLGLKLIANVTYGYTAANFSGRMPCIELGDSVVSKGRETLQRAINLVEKTKAWDAKVVYGDTDSLFVLVKGRSRQDAFKIGAEIAHAVTEDNPSPVKLKLEKVFLPCILQTKKRYVGYMYESVNQSEPEFLAKGIETVRRDGCPAGAKMLEKCLKLLFDTRDVSLVKRYVCRQFGKLLTGRVSIQDLTFAKEYRGSANYKAGACVPSLELARKWITEDKRKEPRKGERVPYVIVNGPPGLPLIKLVRSPRDLMADQSLRANAIYYITKVIIPPINRCFLLIGADLNQWFAEMPRKQIQYLPTSTPGKNKTKKSTISQYFSSLNCAICGIQTQNGLCPNCLAKPQESCVLLYEKIRIWEKNYHETLSMCQSCCGRIEDITCISLDCPAYYRRIQTERDIQQSAFVRQLIVSLPELEF